MRTDLQDTLNYHNIEVVAVDFDGVNKFMFTDKDGFHDGDGEYYDTHEEAALAAIAWVNEFKEPDYNDDGMTDAEADADVLRNAGMGTDEDYGLFHDVDSFYESE